MKTKKRMPLLAGAAALAMVAGTTLSFSLAMTGGDVVVDPTRTGMVYLTFPGHVCSGTLLSPTWVLTARHCVVPTSPIFDDDGVLTPDAPGLYTRAGARAAVWDPLRTRFVLAGWVEDASLVPPQRAPALWAFDLFGDAPILFGEDAEHVTVPLLAGVAGHGAELAAIALAGDGSGDVITAGTAELGGLARMIVLRFDGNGTLEKAPLAAAGSPGATLGFAPAPLGTARAVAVDPATGDVIVVGSRLDRGVERWAAARFAGDGTPRADYAYLDELVLGGRLVDVAVVAGQVVVIGVHDARPAIAVLGAAALGPAGVRPIAADAFAEARALAVDTAGRVLVVGHDAEQDRVRAVRYAVAGLVPDAGYGTGGVASLSALVEDADVTVNVVDAAVDAAGRLVVALALESPQSHAAATVARFTTAGQPDPAFGQLGLVVTSDKAPREAAGLALGPGGALVVGHAPMSLGLAALRFEEQHDVVPAATRVRLGVSAVGVTRVLRHPDASYDAALLELSGPLVVGALGQVRFGGLAADTEALGGQNVVCYGYGRDDAGDTGTLRRGEFVVDGVASHDLVIASICSPGAAGPEGCSAGIQGGDSGGACFADDAGAGASWIQLGVTRATIGNRGEKSWYPASQRQFFVRAERIAEWVGDVTGLEVTP